MVKTQKQLSYSTLEERSTAIKEWEQSGESVSAFCLKKNTSRDVFYKWKPILEEWRKSGKSIEKFSQEKKISRTLLYKWKKKFYPELAKRGRSQQQKQWEIIYEEWKKSGLTRNAFCKNIGINKDTFSRWRRQFNPADMKKAALPKTPEEWKNIIEDWKQSGLYISDYCKQKKIGDSTFREWYRKLCSPSERKTVKKRSREEWKILIQDYDETEFSVTEYCKRKGIGSSTFYKWIKRLDQGVKTSSTMDQLNNFNIPSIGVQQEKQMRDSAYFRKRKTCSSRSKALAEKWKKVFKKWESIFDDW